MPSWWRIHPYLLSCLRANPCQRPLCALHRMVPQPARLATLKGRTPTMVRAASGAPTVTTAHRDCERRECTSWARVARVLCQTGPASNRNGLCQMQVVNLMNQI